MLHNVTMRWWKLQFFAKTIQYYRCDRQFQILMLEHGFGQMCSKFQYSVSLHISPIVCSESVKICQTICNKSWDRDWIQQNCKKLVSLLLTSCDETLINYKTSNLKCILSCHLPSVRSNWYVKEGNSSENLLIMRESYNAMMQFAFIWKHLRSSPPSKIQYRWYSHSV